MAVCDWTIESSLTERTASLCAVSHTADGAVNTVTRRCVAQQITDSRLYVDKRERRYSRTQLHMQSHKQKTHEERSSEVQWQGKVQPPLHTMVSSLRIESNQVFAVRPLTKGTDPGSRELLLSTRIITVSVWLFSRAVII